MMLRRGFLGGLLAMPAVIRTPGLLMSIKPLPEYGLTEAALARSFRNLRLTPAESLAARKIIVPLELLGPTALFFGEAWTEVAA